MSPPLALVWGTVLPAGPPAGAAVGAAALAAWIRGEALDAGELVPAYLRLPQAERELLKSPRLNVSEQAGRACATYADVYVKDGEEISLAGMTCKVIATPGHTAGGCCYFFAEAGILVSGDTLFAESVGRTDFPTGSMGTLVRSIKEKLFVLPEDTRVYAGHGESTTIGYEKKNNPFCV